ncbi:MAG: selenide, water dikinase SelD [Betaproteobacteria bacterium]|nr:selenide, water dikinase SelD [Betaproteobacteria bacterium]
MIYNGRLTSLSHGGGCGCKIAPGVLSNILKSSPVRQIPAALLAGNDNNEDAAVYQLNDHQAIVATTDFFMPMVDDPYQFGRIAATNAISDIYAMGAQPLFASAQIQWDAIPVIEEAVKLVKDDVFTGASVRNWSGYGHEIQMSGALQAWHQNLLSDPQTSGGLLIACDPEASDQVLEILQADGFTNAKNIGTFAEGSGLSVV